MPLQVTSLLQILVQISVFTADLELNQWTFRKQTCLLGLLILLKQIAKFCRFCFIYGLDTCVFFFCHSLHK